MRRLGFWKSLWGVCCGTAVFDTLKQHSWLRTIWHLFALAFLCAIGVVVVTAVRMKPEVAQAEERFTADFGGIRMEQRGIVPLIEPDKARDLIFSGRHMLIYRPTLEEGVKIQPEDLSLLRSCFVWAPGFLGNVIRDSGEDVWRVSELAPGQASATIKRIDGSNRLAEYLTGIREETGREWKLLFLKEGDELKGSEIFFLVRGMMLFIFFLLSFGMIFLQPWLYTGIFVGVFRLTGRGFRSMNWSEYWKVGLYAGFPAMLIASFCSAFELLFMSYSIVYMVGLMIYWMVVAARLERSWGPPEEEGGAHNE